MTGTSDMRRGGIDRRDFLITTAGVAAAAVGVGTSGTALAQASAPPAPSSETPPPTKAILVERLPGGILMIGIDRPEAKNRIDPAMLLGIGKAYYQLEHDDELRVGVLYAKGPDFVSGLDVPAYEAAARAGQLPPKDPDFIQPAGLRAPSRTKPVVVAVQGATRTVGHELMLACDVRVAADDTVFAQSEVTAGLFAIAGATIRFPREAGWANAMRYMLTGDTWNADG